MTRDAKRRPRAENRELYGNAPLVNSKVSIPEPLREWLDEYARKRNISRSAVILEAIECWIAATYDFMEEEHGISMPPFPGITIEWAFSPSSEQQEE